MADLETATSEIIGVIAATWRAGAPSLVDGAIALMIEIRDGNSEPVDTVEAWARITLRHGEADSYAFGRRYDNGGTAYVNIFVKSSEAAGGIALRLAKMVSGGIRAHKSGNVEFSRVRPQEAGISNAWTQYNVLAQFSYGQGN